METTAEEEEAAAAAEVEPTKSVLVDALFRGAEKLQL